VAPTPTERIRANQRKGAKAERRAGIDPNLAKTRIFPYQNDPSASPKQRQKYRIPDELNREERVLREVKNVQKLSATSQLRDMAKWAADNGYTMVIVVDQGRTQGADAVERTLEAQAAQNGKHLDVVIDARPLS
jgi:DNA invertase Pin-like site-specific DNA recombinase